MARALSPETCERIRRLCKVHLRKDVATLVGVSETTIWQLAKRNWQPVQIGRQRKPMPGDFAIQANHMTIPELLKHYQVAAQTLHGWLGKIDRQYTPRPMPDHSAPLIAKDVIEATIARVGITKAAAALGLSDNTLRKMRAQHGMTIKRRRSPKKLRLAASTPAAGSPCWAEQYFERRAA